MKESENIAVSQNEELVDVFLDFIIASTILAKKINRAVNYRKIMEGGKINEQDE